jgi:hypothetical protein
MLGCWWFSYAQASCDACSTAPQALDRYIQTMQRNVGKVLYVKPDEETANPTTNAARATRNALNQAQVMLLLAEILFATPGDVWLDLKNMAKSVPQKRDWDALLQIDQKISDATLDLIQDSNHNAKVTTAAAELLEQMFKDMWGWIVLDKNKQTGDYDIVAGKTTYRELAKFLWGLNMYIKKAHSRRWYTSYIWDVGKNADVSLYKPNESYAKQLSWDLEKIKYALTNNDFWRDFVIKKSVTQNDQRSSIKERLTFSSTDTLLWMRTIEQKYQCADGMNNECSDGMKTIWKNNWSIYKDRVTEDSNSAWTTIKEATIRLLALMHIWSDENIEVVNQRKRALANRWDRFQTNIEVERNKYTSKRMNSVGSLRKKIFKSEQTSQDPVNAGGEETMLSTSLPKGEKDARGIPDPKTYQSEQAKQDAVKQAKADLDAQPKPMDDARSSNLRSESNNQNIAVRKDLISQSIQWVLVVQDAMTKEHIFHDPKGVTMQFPALSRKVYENINTIGRKGLPNSLIQNMGEVCGLQCTNLQGRCWYHED